MGSGKEYPVDWWRDRVLLTEVRRRSINHTRRWNQFRKQMRGIHEDLPALDKVGEKGSPAPSARRMTSPPAHRRAPCGQPWSAITRFRSGGRADPTGVLNAKFMAQMVQAQDHILSKKKSSSPHGSGLRHYLLIVMVEVQPFLFKFSFLMF